MEVWRARRPEENCREGLAGLGWRRRWGKSSAVANQPPERILLDQRIPSSSTRQQQSKLERTTSPNGALLGCPLCQLSGFWHSARPDVSALAAEALARVSPPMDRPRIPASVARPPAREGSLGSRVIPEKVAVWELSAARPIQAPIHPTRSTDTDTGCVPGVTFSSDRCRCKLRVHFWGNSTCFHFTKSPLPLSDFSDTQSKPRSAAEGKICGRGSLGSRPHDLASREGQFLAIRSCANPQNITSTSGRLYVRVALCQAETGCCHRQ